MTLQRTFFTDWELRLADALAGAAKGRPLDDSAAWALVGADDDILAAMCEAAGQMRDLGKGRIVTFSPKVFIPLTHMCRDFCGYCIFRKSPEQAGDTLYMTPEQVLDVARAGQRLGCTEALFPSASARSSVTRRPRTGLKREASRRRWSMWPTSTGWCWRKRPSCPMPTPAP